MHRKQAGDHIGGVPQQEDVVEERREADQLENEIPSANAVGTLVPWSLYLDKHQKVAGLLSGDWKRGGRGTIAQRGTEGRKCGNAQRGSISKRGCIPGGGREGTSAWFISLKASVRHSKTLLITATNAEAGSAQPNMHT